VTLVPPGTFITSPAALGAGYYASRSDLENLFGRDNIAIWSQLDNDSTLPDPRRIGAALAYADAEIDNVFRGGPYLVPLVVSAARPTVQRWAAVIAGAWLYTNRGQRDDGGRPNQYAVMLDEVKTDMRACKAQVKLLDAQPVAVLPSGPVLA
jgi:phage gp36-like protein